MKNRIAVAGPVLGLLVLASCGEGEPDKLNLPLQGDHRLVMTMTDFEMPGLKEGSEGMPESPVGETHDERFCVTRDIASQGFKPFLDRGISQFTGGSETCTYDRYEVSGEDLDAAVTCTSEDGELVMTFALTGSVASQASDVAMKIESNLANDPESRTLAGMHLETQYQGQCLQEMLDNALNR